MISESLPNYGKGDIIFPKQPAKLFELCTLWNKSLEAAL